MPYYLDNAFLLDNPWITVVGCGGTGGFIAEGLCRLFQGREANIVLVDHDRVEPHNLLRQNSTQTTWGASRARPWRTGWREPTGVLSATRSIRSVSTSPSPTSTAIPACPPTETASSSAVQTTPPQGRPWPSVCRETRAGGSSTRATTPTHPVRQAQHRRHRRRDPQQPIRLQRRIRPAHAGRAAQRLLRRVHGHAHRAPGRQHPCRVRRLHQHLRHFSGQ